MAFEGLASVTCTELKKLKLASDSVDIQTASPSFHLLKGWSTRKLLDFFCFCLSVLFCTFLVVAFLSWLWGLGTWGLGRHFTLKSLMRMVHLPFEDSATMQGKAGILVW